MSYSKQPTTFEADSKTILVVDDVENIRISLQYMLSRKGYHVLTASDGGEALEILNRVDIDLVISDIGMPVLNGLELVEQINKQYRPPEILLITGQPSLETATSAIRLGIFEYITKPIVTDALMTTVHRALEKKSLLDEQERLEQQNQRYLRDLEEKYDQRTYNLLQTEEKYRSLFENSNVGVGVATFEGDVIEVNTTMCRMTGYSPEEFKNQSVMDSFQDKEVGKKLFRDLKSEKRVDDFEAQLIRSNGSTYWASLSVKAITYKGEDVYLTTKLDITARKENELSLKRALADKEEMLREIHHRTKNNMNVIISLLNMQAHTSDNQGIKDILNQIRDRVYSMSLVHEHIYASDELSSVDLSRYIKALHLRHYSAVIGGGQDVQVEMDLPATSIGLSQAIPLGLALNEVLANVVKHPFHNQGSGKIEIKLERIGDHGIWITVQDNGCGFPDHLDLLDPATLGLHMAKILVTDQLGGELVLRSDHGAFVQIQFSLEFESTDHIVPNKVAG